jgi:hypothetical protein
MIYLVKHNVTVRDSVPEDIESLSNTMREADRMEIWAQSHSTPKESLDYAFTHSDISLTVLYKDKIAAMFGVYRKSLLGDKGIVWLLSSDQVPAMTLTFAKYSKPFIQKFLECYSVLENWVDSRYTTSLNWLKWCGFTVGEAEQCGIEKKNFNHVFIRRA